MTNIFCNRLLVSSALSGAIALLGTTSASAIDTDSTAIDSADRAVPKIFKDVTEGAAIQLAQVTSVSELSDVQPGDWAYTALQRLVEEYGCLEGYPDRTYRGNRALTRYEFAAGLNACLDVVVQLIGTGVDMDAIRRLQQEFAAELATVRGDIDALQTDVAELEANQFSTTTKLRGQLDAHLVVPFGEADGFDDDLVEFTLPSEAEVADGENLGDGDDEPNDGADVGGEEADATFEYRARLNFDTSFTGEDRLRVRLQASDDARALLNTESGLADQSSRRGGLEDNVALDDIYYSFPIGNRISGIIAASSVATDDFVSSTVVPFDGSSIADAGSPEFYDLYEGGDFGAGVNIAFTRNLVLDAGYSSDSSNENTEEGGLFNDGSYIAQLNLLTDGIFNAAVTYIGATDDAEGDDAQNTIAGLLNLDFGGFQVAGHYASTEFGSGDRVDSYMGGLAIADLFGVGNELGLYGGISPEIGRDPILVEAYYQIAVNQFFTFTPAVVYADNDGQGDDTDNFYGALRASFRF